MSEQHPLLHELLKKLGQREGDQTLGTLSNEEIKDALEAILKRIEDEAAARKAGL